MAEYAYTKQKQREAFDWIGSHPISYMGKTARRVMQFWFEFAHPVRMFLYQSTWFFKIQFLYICALLVLMFSGLITIRRKRREYFWLLASFPAIFPLLYYVTLARDFHRFPIDPVLAVVADFGTSLPIYQNTLRSPGFVRVEPGSGNPLFRHPRDNRVA